jgi:hypothetical protein
MKGMAAQQAAYPHPAPAHGSVTFDGFERVFRTGWDESARGREQGREKRLVESKQRCESDSYQLLFRFARGCFFVTFDLGNNPLQIRDYRADLLLNYRAAGVKNPIVFTTKPVELARRQPESLTQEPLRPVTLHGEPRHFPRSRYAEPVLFEPVRQDEDCRQTAFETPAPVVNRAKLRRFTQTRIFWQSSLDQ